MGRKQAYRVKLRLNYILPELLKLLRVYVIVRVLNTVNLRLVAVGVMVQVRHARKKTGLVEENQKKTKK